MKRRRFLQTAAAAGSLPLLATCGEASPPTISDREFSRIAADKVLDLEGLTSPVIIESVELRKLGRDYIVHVRSKDGAEGIAYDNGRAAIFWPIFQEHIVPFFIGRDARNLEDDLFELYRYESNYKLQGLAFWSPHAWMEFAILDMLGRIAGKSFGELFGGVVRSEVACYVASGNRDTTPEEEVEYLQQLLDETQLKAVKFRVGGRMSRNRDSMPDRTKNLILAARRGLGDEIDIHADSNSSYDPEHAIPVGRMLEEINAVYFEEPCPFDHLWETKEVADALTIPVAGGEQEFSQRRFQWQIKNRAVDIVQPDLHYYGGLIRSTRVAKMAALAGMPTTVHISGGLGFVYMLHFASFTPDIGRYQEYKRGIERYAEMFDPKLEIRDGKVTVPRGPGVGIKDIGAVLKDSEKIGL
jgi:L-alanine-DL-glutamate epimerase-like enolase superfamily enzyme